MSELKVADEVRRYREAGVAVARIRKGQKRPTDAGWTTKSAELGQFRDGDNVGLVCGWLSDGLVCVDLDSPEAVRLADDYLPETGAIEGRPGKLRSHRWYRVTDVPDWATSRAGDSAKAAIAAGKHPGPFKKQFRGTDGRTHIDFQGSGGQAVVPPSRHDSGEVRAWEPGHWIDKAAVLPFETLWNDVCSLARAAGAKVPDVRPKAPKPPRAVPPPSPARTPRQAKVPPPVAATAAPCDLTMDERVKRCREWLPRAPLAVSGHGGHTTTYKVARIITNDHQVTDRERAMELLGEYNGMLKAAGQEAWSQTELEHKIDDALAAPPDAKHPPGSALRPPRKWDDPARLADEFLETRTLRFVKDTGFEYRDGA